MKNKAPIISLLCLIFALSIFLVWFIKRDNSVRPPIDPGIQAQSSSNIPVARPPISESGASQSNSFDAMMKTPIEFYGIVLDQDGSPVASATINASVLDSWKGSPVSTTSAKDGKFEILSKGTAIHIKVEKPGYYGVEKGGNLSPSIQGFDFGIENSPRAYKSNPAVPAVFNLRKAGNQISLERLNGQSKIPRDGTVVPINLLKTGQLKLLIGCRTMEDKTQPPNAPYDWRCEVSVDGGVVQEVSDESNFLAPDSGYQTAFVIDMPKSMDAKAWSSRVNKKLWIQLGDRTYAKISFMMNARGDHFAVAEGHRNPTPNDRNLETK